MLYIGAIPGLSVMTKRKKGKKGRVARSNKINKSYRAKSNFSDLGWSGETRRVNQDELFRDMEKEMCCMKKCDCIYPKVCDKCKEPK